MSRDLRELLKGNEMGEAKLSKNHRAKFEAKLQTEMHSKKEKNYTFLKIAASILLLIAIGATLYFSSKNNVPSLEKAPRFSSLGSISPELKNVENFYIASIQTEIANLEENADNKELLDGYLEKIGELSEEYKLLTVELNEEGLNEKTVNALIENLQLRLKLLYQLKAQLNNLKNSNTQENENLQV